MIRRLLELVYPENIYCMCCGAYINKTRAYALCDSCMEAFHWQTGRTCRKCGKGLQDTFAGEICYSCMEQEHSFDAAFSCVTYGLNERALLMDFKYGDQTYIGRKIAEIMKDRMALEDISYDLVVPIPIHENRKNSRGYNQAEIIAKEFANLTKTRYNQCIERVRETVPMRNLSADEREINIRDAFRVSGDIANKDILLIDDIYTTGATMDAAAMTLKKQGSGKVYGLCFAAGVNRKPAGMEEW